LNSQLREQRITVSNLDWTSVRSTPRMFPRLLHAVRTIRPDFVQGWMIHGSIAAQLSKLFSPHVPVLWSVRNALHESRLANRFASVRRSTWGLGRMLGWMSSWPARIVYNSRVSARQHEGIGYDPRRTVVIPNGFDCGQFHPRPESRVALRAMLGVHPDTPLIGLIARVHPVKDHSGFLDAAQRMAQSDSRVHFVLIGRDTDCAQLASAIGARGLRGRVHALGQRADIPELTAALDIATCCSRSESFANVIGEAMASGIPCVVTNVGDSAEVVADTGLVVNPGDPAALSCAWSEILRLNSDRRRQMGASARERILQHYSLDRTVSSYERLYDDVLAGGLA
jgi:glycosyltransferase involved in cell wall biosynthesis